MTIATPSDAVLETATSFARVAVEHVPDLLRLLHAVDTFPRGGMYTGYYAVTAAMRYEKYWLRVLHEGKTDVLPPLDVAFAWFVHRNDPAGYARCMAEAGCPAAAAHPGRRQAFGFGATGTADGAAWEAAAGEHPAWPPPCPGSPHDCAGELPPPWDLGIGDLGEPGEGPGGGPASAPVFALLLVRCMARFAGLLRSWLRPHFLDADFLERAAVRYARFLALRAAHPTSPHPLVPAADMALLWHAHAGAAGEYGAACAALFGTPSSSPSAPSPPPSASAASTSSSHSPSSAGPEDAAPAAAEGAAAADGCQRSPPTAANGGPTAAEPWAPLSYLELGGEAVLRALHHTARLYEQTYGEPFECPDTAWVPLSAPYPPAGPHSPLAPLLARAFDENPQQEGHRWALERAAAASELDFPRAGAPVARAGAHALFAAWLAAGRAGRCMEEAAARGGCAALCGAEGSRRDALAHAAVSLASLAYFLELPAWSGHPYLQAIRVRRGLWRPGQQAQKQQPQQRQLSGGPAPASAAAGPGGAPAAGAAQGKAAPAAASTAAPGGQQGTADGGGGGGGGGGASSLGASQCASQNTSRNTSHNTSQYASQPTQGSLAAGSSYAFLQSSHYGGGSTAVPTAGSMPTASFSPYDPEAYLDGAGGDGRLAGLGSLLAKRAAAAAASGHKITQPHPSSPATPPPAPNHPPAALWSALANPRNARHMYDSLNRVASDAADLGVGFMRQNASKRRNSSDGWAPPPNDYYPLARVYPEGVDVHFAIYTADRNLARTSRASLGGIARTSVASVASAASNALRFSVRSLRKSVESIGAGTGGGGGAFGAYRRFMWNGGDRD